MTASERSEEAKILKYVNLKNLAQVKESLESAILTMEKVHHNLVNLVYEDRSEATKVPLLDRSNALLEETIDLLIDVKAERWT
tara:strand:- start:206 stop:454 length:249 start_codon:yes stop_codon:yes gene_type:complete